jgi:hypothetical protein
LGEAERLRKDNPSPYGFVTKKELKNNNNFDGGWCLSTIILTKKEGQSNLYKEWAWHTLELQSWKHIWWVSLHNSYGKKY